MLNPQGLLPISSMQGCQFARETRPAHVVLGSIFTNGDVGKGQLLKFRHSKVANEEPCDGEFGSSKVIP